MHLELGIRCVNLGQNKQADTESIKTTSRGRFVMIIKQVKVNNNKKCLEIATGKGKFSLPFAKLRVIPTPENKIKTIYIDKELARMGVTYILESGEEDSVIVDVFLDYNKEPEYMR